MNYNLNNNNENKNRDSISNFKDENVFNLSNDLLNDIIYKNNDTSNKINENLGKENNCSIRK